MPDKMTIEQRHHNMAAIRGKDTKPEILVGSSCGLGDSVSAQSSTVAGKTGYCAQKVSYLHSGEWMLLAWT